MVTHDTRVCKISQTVCCSKQIRILMSYSYYICSIVECFFDSALLLCTMHFTILSLGIHCIHLPFCRDADDEMMSLYLLSTLHSQYMYIQNDNDKCNRSYVICRPVWHSNSNCRNLYVHFCKRNKNWWSTLQNCYFHFIFCISIRWCNVQRASSQKWNGIHLRKFGKCNGNMFYKLLTLRLVSSFWIILFTNRTPFEKCERIESIRVLYSFIIRLGLAWLVLLDNYSSRSHALSALHSNVPT